jgi:hypothetical protein
MAPQPPPPHPQHTDQCLLDYARFGLCEHTRLTSAGPVRLVETRPLHTPYPPRAAPEGGSPQQEARRTRRREILRYVGFLALLLYTYLTAVNPANSLLDILLLVTLPGLGWLITLTLGLPSLVRLVLTYDIRTAIPRGTTLDDLAPPARPRSKRKKKGPSAG